MIKLSISSVLGFIVLWLAAFCAYAESSGAATQAIQVQLAQVYEPHRAGPVSDYLVSEKYDGVRAIWTGERLLTRNGNPIHAPEWFVAPLPDVWLDGELWTQRQDFEAVSRIVRTNTPNDRLWRKVRYKVFDMPDAQLPFEQRYKNYSELVKQINAEHIEAVEQRRFTSPQALDEHLKVLVKNGAEGLMLHLASAHHAAGRSNALLKLKPFFDDEAVVIGHLPGKGKYTNMLGALRVRNEQGLEFSVGTGFTDNERANPPPVGSVITYKYHGYTNSGLPRFASFLRVRDDMEQ